MTQSLVHQLQAEAVDDSSSISSLLMKAKLIAFKLGLEDLSEWIDYELKGYPTRADVPPYRKFSCQPQAFNPARGWIPIDFEGISTNLLNEFMTIYLQEPISNVEKHAATSGKLEIRMPHNLSEIIHAGRITDFKFKISWRFSAFVLSGVLSAVRERLLTWAIDLEKQGILGEGVNFSFREKEKASMTFKNDFNGAVIHNNGVMASHTADVNQENTMSVGSSFESLKDELKKLGINDAEIEELKVAIESSEKPLTEVGFSQNVSNWIAKIAGKAMQGGLKVSGAVAVNVIAKLITTHLGG